MNYFELHSSDDWRNALQGSAKNESFLVVFKHSTRCFTSMMAWRRLKSEWSLDTDQVPFYFLDLIRHRDISNEITEESGVRHESPQIIIFKNGKAVFNESHSEIDANQIAEFVQNQLVV